MNEDMLMHPLTLSEQDVFFSLNNSLSQPAYIDISSLVYHAQSPSTKSKTSHTNAKYVKT